MPGLDITQVTIKAEQPSGRAPGNASGDSAQEFATVSRQQQQHLEQRRAEQDRLAQRRAERDQADQRLQDKRAENRQAADDARQKNSESAKAGSDSDRSPERAETSANTINKNANAEPDENRSTQRADETNTAEQPAKQPSTPEKDGQTAPSAIGTEQLQQRAGDMPEKAGDDLPFLAFAAPVAPVPIDGLNPTLKSAATGKNGSGASASASANLLQGNSSLSQFFNKLAGITPVDNTGMTVGDKGSGSPGAGLTGETLSGFLLKGAPADASKAADFSAQLARFHGGGDGQALQNSAASPQRGLETMAPLKSYATSIDVPVQHAEWGEKVAGKLAWLTAQRMSAAEIHITPPDMGPMDVRVQVQNDQAHVTVHASNSAVRDQLELNGHRLRDMLQENGLNLDSFDVSSQAEGEGRDGSMSDDDQSTAGGGSHAGIGEGDEQGGGVTATGNLDLSLRGEVDTYA